jgi:hypothetical protein
MRTRRRRTRGTQAIHKPTGIMFCIVGARRAELGNVFVVIHETDSRERMFLTEGFDLPAVQRESLWLKLFDAEQTRMKLKHKREIGEANPALVFESFEEVEAGD